MLAVACLLVLAPLLGLRDLGRLGPMSTAGVAIAGGFAAAVVAVTGIAFAKGEVGGELHAEYRDCCQYPCLTRLAA